MQSNADERLLSVYDKLHNFDEIKPMKNNIVLTKISEVANRMGYEALSNISITTAYNKDHSSIYSNIPCNFTFKWLPVNVNFYIHKYCMYN